MVELVERGLDAAVRLDYPSAGAVWECIAPAAWKLAPAPHEALTEATIGEIPAPRSGGRTASPQPR